MRYAGGKVRQSKILAPLLAWAAIREGSYVEPFCGALGVASKVVPRLPRSCGITLRDENRACVYFWAGLVSGSLILPGLVSEEEYFRRKANPDSADPMTFFVGHAYSFGGKFFGGYAPSSPNTRFPVKDFAATANKSCQKKAAKVRGATWEVGDYRGALTKDSVLYLDPPYAGSSLFGDFDSGAFWEWARHRVKESRVLVTERSAPFGWVPVFSWGNTACVANHRDGTRRPPERIWVHRSQVAYWREVAQTQGIPLLV